MHKFDRRLERLAMVMPLTDQFDPGVTGFAHKHLQVSPSFFARLRFPLFFLPRPPPFFFLRAEGRPQGLVTSRHSRAPIL